MTTIIASITLAFALYFTTAIVVKIAGLILNNKDRPGMTRLTAITCAFWGLFYYCTHLLR